MHPCWPVPKPRALAACPYQRHLAQQGRGLGWSGKAGGGLDSAPLPWRFTPTVHRAVGGGLGDPCPQLFCQCPRVTHRQLTLQLLSMSSVLGPVPGGCMPATGMCPTGA